MHRAILVIAAAFALAMPGAAAVPAGVSVPLPDAAPSSHCGSPLGNPAAWADCTCDHIVQMVSPNLRCALA